MSYVLIHGGLLTGHCWREVVPLLKGRATAPDLPGRSGNPASHRAFVNKEQATQQTIEQSTQKLQQDVPQQTQQPAQQPQQAKSMVA